MADPTSDAEEKKPSAAELKVKSVVEQYGLIEMKRVFDLTGKNQGSVKILTPLPKKTNTPTREPDRHKAQEIWQAVASATQGVRALTLPKPLNGFLHVWIVGDTALIHELSIDRMSPPAAVVYEGRKVWPLSRLLEDFSAQATAMRILLQRLDPEKTPPPGEQG